MKRRKMFLAIAVSMFMLLGFLPGIAVADDPEPAPNFAFIPNANEASVSKVDLVNAVEVARYSTIEPRNGDFALDKYRVSRLAIEHETGNAWALNTMTGQNFDEYAEAQGSVARISFGPVLGEDATNTSTTGGPDGIVTNDVRVTYHPLGEPGDGPRTITIVEDEGEVYLWIGFYLGSYFQKYWYDADTGELKEVADGRIDVDELAPYTAALDANGMMWVVSRNASPFPAPTQTPAVFRFDTDNLGAEIEKLDYEVPGNNPYGILVASDGSVWVSDGSDWFASKNRQFLVYDGITGVGLPVPIGFNAQAMRGFIEFDGAIWATCIDGRVFKGVPDNGGWDFSIEVEGLGELAGIGPDNADNLWVVRHGANMIFKFDPTDPTEATKQANVPVGLGPYAYDNFVVPVIPEYDICGFKFLGDTETGLAGWTITLEKLVEGGDMGDDDDWLPVASTSTSDGTDGLELGQYCFSGLLAGIYRVSETVEDPSWTQTYPFDDGQEGGEWVHIVTLPGGETVLDPETEELEPLYNFRNVPELECFGDTAWASMHLPGQDRFVNPGNWATFLTIALADLDELEEGDMLSFPLYAGQHYLVGMLNVMVDEEGDIFVQYTTDIPQGVWDHYILKGGLEYEKEGYEGDWSHFTEFHLHVVDEFADFNAVRTTQGRLRSPGNPIPGAFDYIAEYDCEDMMFDSDPIFVGNVEDFEDDFFVAAHAVIQWCGYADDNGNGENGVTSFGGAQILGLVE